MCSADVMETGVIKRLGIGAGCIQWCFQKEFELRTANCANIVDSLFVGVGELEVARCTATKAFAFGQDGLLP